MNLMRAPTSPASPASASASGVAASASGAGHRGPLRQAPAPASANGPGG